MAKIKQIKLKNVIYDLKDSDIDSLLSMTLSTNNNNNVNEKYWVPTTTDKTKFDSLTEQKVVNLKGSVNSRADLPNNAISGDLYIVKNNNSDTTSTSDTTDLVEEWLKTDNGWEMLGVIKADIDISGKADKSSVHALFNAFTATPVSQGSDDYILTIPEATSATDLTVKSYV